jgi:hypothetical protein
MRGEVNWKGIDDRRGETGGRENDGISGKKRREVTVTVTHVTSGGGTKFLVFSST